MGFDQKVLFILLGTYRYLQPLVRWLNGNFIITRASRGYSAYALSNRYTQLLCFDLLGAFARLLFGSRMISQLRSHARNLALCNHLAQIIH